MGKFYPKTQEINKKKIEKVQNHDSQHYLYYADLFSKKMCPAALFNNPICAYEQKGTGISAETDHLVFKKQNYRM